MNGLRKRVAGASSIKLTQEIRSFEVEDSDFRVDRMLPSQLGLFLRRQASRDPLGDLARYFALHGQRVAQFPLVALRPQVPIRGRMNQLGSDAHLTTRPGYRSLNEGVFPSDTRTLSRRPASSKIGHGRSSRDDSQ